MRRMLQFAFLLCLAAALGVAQDRGSSGQSYKVKYVDVKTIYLDAGRNAGLAPGMWLVVKRSRVSSAYAGDGQFKGHVIVARLTVVSVSSTSAMCEVRSQIDDVRRGDLVFPQESEPKIGQPAVAETRTPVFKPALNQIDNEHEKQTAAATATGGTIAPSAAKSTPPTTIADAARANRNQPLRTEPVVTDKNPPAIVASAPVVQAAASTAPQPVAATPAPSPAPNNDVAKAEPLSLGEIARRNRLKSQAPTTAPTASDSKPTVTASNNAPASTNQSSARISQPVDAQTTSLSVPRNETAVAAAEPITPSNSSGNATPSVPIEAKRLGPMSSPAPTVVPSASTSSPIQVTDRKTTVAAPAKSEDTASNGATPFKGNPEAPVKTSGVVGTQVAAARSAQPQPAASAAPTIAPAPAAAGQKQQEIASSAVRPVAPEIAPPAPSMNVMSPVVSGPSSADPVKVDFKVKYVAEDAIYIEGGKNAGLTEGMALTITRADGSSPDPKTIAEVAVVSVSNTSAVCEIKEKSADIQRGDIALLAQSDQQKIVEARTLTPNRKYPQLIAFSEGDPLDEEARDAVPKPPSPEVNRARGRIGVDYSFINSRSPGASSTTMQTGGVVRVDMSRIGGSYWNLNGYWRGRLNLSNSSAQPQTVYDLVNRTYTIGFTYMNPNSQWTAGLGRLFLPWATSLDTIDGGYFGRKLGSHTILGAFAGTTPDPASFDYNPDRRMAGTFVAFEGGSFDRVRFTSTEGVAVSGLQWREDRQFVFSENGLFYKRFLSIYHSAQADIQRLPTGGTTEGLSRSFATLRLQPWSRFSIDVNHNYFRDVPTFDPSLVGTGLLDKFLFQGVSVGGRLELPGRISIYNNLGQSNSSADTHSSLNQLYGLTLGRLWKTGLRGDIRYSKFNSSFGHGNYRAASLSRNFSERMRIEVNAGQQVFLSSLGVPTDYRLLGATVDLNLGGHYFIESAFNLQRSSQQNFDQWLTTVGYRFDSGRRK